jgi:acetyl-CoA C-acetyltransferase
MLGTLIDELLRQRLDNGIVAASGAAGSGSALLLERC